MKKTIAYKKYLLSEYGSLFINEKSKQICWQDKSGYEIVFDYLLFPTGSFTLFVLSCLDFLLDRYKFNF